MHLDIFCQVVDNYGDIGVCWRLSKQLSEHHAVKSLRLFVDDLSAFSRIEPSVRALLRQQQIAGISVCSWSAAETYHPAEIVIETFGCELPLAYTEKMAAHTSLWLNLEYLSAETWIEDLHTLPSPQPNGVAKYFFFPGFTAKTGGLLQPTTRTKATADFWQRLAVAQPKTDATAFVFTYDNAPIDTLYSALAKDSHASWTILIAATTPEPKLPLAKNLQLQRLPYISQADFDVLLDYADLNIVRGEDSFVRAIWAANPFIWQPYTQSDQTHLEKLSAWLQTTPFDDQIQQLIYDWNQSTITVPQLQSLLLRRADWQQQAKDYALNLGQQPSLSAQLIAFCSQMQQKAVK